jgi:hypothetical protein
MKTKLFLISLILGICVHLSGQTTGRDYAIIGDVSNDQNLKQVKMRYAQQGNAYFVLGMEANPIEMITDALKKRGPIDELHIYLRTDKDGLVFNDANIITLSNVDQYSESLKKWKEFVSVRVVIFNKDVFSSPDGIKLKEKLESLSGLEFISR